MPLGLPLRVRSDEQLLALFRAGNEDAFRVIYERYRQRLFAYTRQMLPGLRQDAEDALQDVFVRAYFSLRTDNRQLALRPWLYRVAHNRCVDQLRRPPQPLPEALEPALAPLSDPLAAAEQREALRRLVQDIRRLPEHQRSVLLMRELSGMSYAELSEALGISIAAIKSLLVRARLGLAQAAQARDTACSQIREDLAEAHDRGVRPSGNTGRHLRDCASCRQFRRELRGISRQLSAIAPLGPVAAIAKLLGLGSGGAASGAGASGAAGSSTAGMGAAGTSAAGVGAAGASAAGVGAAGTSAGASTIIATGGLLAGGATHAAAVLAAAAIAAGSAVGLTHPSPPAIHPQQAVLSEPPSTAPAPAGSRAAALAVQGTIEAAEPVAAAVAATAAIAPPTGGQAQPQPPAPTDRPLPADAGEAATGSPGEARQTMDGGGFGDSRSGRPAPTSALAPTAASGLLPVAAAGGTQLSSAGEGTAPSTGSGAGGQATATTGSASSLPGSSSTGASGSSSTASGSGAGGSAGRGSSDGGSSSATTVGGGSGSSGAAGSSSSGTIPVSG